MIEMSLGVSGILLSLALLVALGAAEDSSGGVPQPTPRITEERAVELASNYAAERFGNLGLSGSSLDYPRASAGLSTNLNEWIVFIPEQRPRARPNGQTIAVDVKTGRCRALAVE